MIKKRQLLLLIILITITQKANSDLANTQPNIQTGSKVLKVSHNTAPLPSRTAFNWQITLQSKRQSANYQKGFSIESLQITETNRFHIDLQEIAQTENSIKINVITSNFSNIRLLKIRYIIAMNIFMDLIIGQVTYIELQKTNVKQIQKTIAISDIDLSSEIELFTVISGFDIQVNDQNSLLIMPSLNLNWKSSTNEISLIFNIQQQMVSQQSTRFLRMLYIIYPSDQSDGQLLFYTYRQRVENENIWEGEFVSVDSNIIYGLRSIAIINLNGKLLFLNNVNQTAIQSFFDHDVLHFEIHLLMVFQNYNKQCEFPYYFNPQDSICYPECPLNLYQQKSTMLCLPCPQVCEDNCLKCNYTSLQDQAFNNISQTAISSVRLLVGCGGYPCNLCDNGTCLDCYSGYFLNNVNDCISCKMGCDSCTNSFNCFSCDNSYYMQSSNNCQPCTSPCASCSSISTSCNSCNIGYYLVANTCPPCDSICRSCVTISSKCTSCYSSHHRTVSSNQCVPMDGYYQVGNLIADPCSAPCAKCVGTSTYCTGCYTYGYYLDNNQCLPCLYTCQACTDALTCATCNSSQSRFLNNSQCDPNIGYFDNGVPEALPCNSTCYRCIGNKDNCISCHTGDFLTASNTCESCNPTCATCSNISTCDSCPSNSFRTLTSSLKCDPTPGYFDNGTIIANKCSSNCLTCSGSSGHCDSCPSGDYLSNNVCTSCKYSCLTCSTGSTCDTCDPSAHRILNSSDCVPMNGYYDQNNTLIAVLCNSSLSHCFICSTGSQCTTCQTLYFLNTSTNNCEVNCNLTNNCSTCSDVSSSVFCNTCYYGYTPVSGICKIICGDSMIGPGQQCDDSNAKGGDGCSSACQIQQYFVCNETGNKNQSVCFLTAMVFSREFVIKSSTANQVILTFSLLPPSVPIYSTINWVTALSLAIPSATIFSVYDPITNRLEVTLDYTTSLSNLQIAIDANFTGQSNALKYLSPNIINDILIADNNLSLEYFSDSNYTSATILKLIATIIGICALVMFIIGYFGAKLVALEFAAIVQITFLALVTQTNVSPNFESLKGLKLCFGFNAFYPYSQKESVPKQFKMAELSAELYRNYNLAAVFILLPPFVGLVCKLLATKPLRKYRKILNIAVDFCIGELSFYGFMFSAYLLFDNLALTLSFNKGTASIGSLIGEVFALAVGVLYFVLLEKKPGMFGEFKRRFLKDFVWEKYYNFLMVERLVVSLCLVLVSNTYAQLGVPILFFTVETFVILVWKPYTGRLEWLRPALNQSITILILGIYLASGILPAQSFIGLNGPTIVVSLLSLSIAYNLFFMFKSLKDSLLRHRNLKKELEQENFEDDQKQKMREMGIRAMCNYRSISQLIDKAMEDIPQKEIVAGWQHYHLLNHAQKEVFQDIKEKIVKSRLEEKIKSNNTKSNIQLVNYNNAAI